MSIYYLRKNMCLRKSILIVLPSYFKLLKQCPIFLIQFINFLSLQVRREQISIIMHVALLEFFCFC